MQVEMLTTVEDSNEFALDDLLARVQPFTIAHRRGKWCIARVDKLRAGVIVNLPTSQAENLLRLGHAKAV